MFDPDERSHFHACLGCGKIITWRFAICGNCEQIFGESSLTWPEWLRESWKLEQRWRRKRIKAERGEIHFTDIFPWKWKDMIFDNEDAQLDSILIKEFFLGLSKRTRLILGLKSIGHKERMIAKIIGFSRTTVNTELNRVKQQLQAQGLF